MIRLGTRGSALALAQARWVAEQIAEQTEIVTITTSGDRGASGLDKSRWVSELEHALLADEVDLAVHSAKDVPAELEAGLALVAFPPRAVALDAICGAPSLAGLSAGARVGTSSLRRAAQIRAEREDLEVVPVRGNVDTRLKKLADGSYDALVLAAAGLLRLDQLQRAGGLLAGLVPAAGQGSLAIEAKLGRSWHGVLDPLRDDDTATCVSAERELVRALGATCNTPLGAHARPIGDDQVELASWLGLPDGSAWLSDRLVAAPEGIGLEVAQRMRAGGATELLEQAERQP